jgi:hypothetical protein
MGKAADNERLKLRGTFFNNISVGILLIGIVTPIAGFYQYIAANVNAPVPFATPFMSPSTLTCLMIFFCAFGLAFKLRELADKAVADIQD